MSDLYLELRSRIPIVAQQTHLGRQRLQDAQDQAGMSNEAIARKVPVSEKTWRRWKERGEIPTSALPAVAKALRLELHQLSPADSDGEVADRLALIERHLESLSRQVAELPTAEDLGGAIATLQAAIDRLAISGTREVRQATRPRKTAQR